MTHYLITVNIDGKQRELWAECLTSDVAAQHYVQDLKRHFSLWGYSIRQVTAEDVKKHDGKVKHYVRIPDTNRCTWSTYTQEQIDGVDA